VIDNGGLTFLIHEGISAEDAVASVARLARRGIEGRGVELPMKKVGARCVTPTMAALILEDVHEVIPTVPIDGAVGVEGHAAAFGIDEVVGGAVRITENEFAK
jgi:hypothetical protein